MTGVGNWQAGDRLAPIVFFAVTLAGGAAFAAGDACVADPAAVAAAKPYAAVTALLPDAMAARLDAAVTAVLGETAAPGVIAGVQTPEGHWEKAYGLADPETGAPMEIGMHTRIGSVTKTFTGTVLMQLVEAGKVSLDDTIGSYIADIPNGDQITLRQLADMTSGLASYTLSDAFQDRLFSHPDRVIPVDELLKYGLDDSPIFAPGARFDYSNTNTVLLGEVIEKVTGKPVGEVFKEQIFQPLGLDNTFWPGTSSEIPAPYPQGFTMQGNDATPDAPTNATHWNPSWGWTAGGMISSLDDLLTYGHALGTGQGLLDPETQAVRLASFPSPSGYGIAMGCVGGWVGHSGELPGYNTTVFYDTTSDTTVVVQTNSDIPSGDCGDAAVLAGNATDMVCSSPATRVFKALAEALGHPYAMP
ncbi:serine hydrolase domain-containing protein [Martelella sp. HB161492]|uniref:serine hydrolase domain-containing protein n=1 Tax=Martelella sp. HB161492 TaxID=2720726 RepID=UPI00159045F3|nr:serine hydrolase domain-containing protein [Martelella sp. HB161492]